MKIIIGLGNPGTEYEKTRHNAGFMVVDALARRHGLDTTPPRTKFHAGMLQGDIAGQRCVLLQPMTFMNRCGLCVSEAVNFYKVDPTTDLLIVVDDVALPVGRVRLRATGGPGGHNGLKDIERVLATRDYARLRIGIDPPGRVPQVDYVLGRFTESQLDELGPAIDRATQAIVTWLEHGIDKAMTTFNADE